MNYTSLSLLIIISKLIYTNSESCVVRGSTMNCAKQNMNDCPVVNSNISELIMDGNKIENFNRGNCGNWTQLNVLHVSNNLLNRYVDLTWFTGLTFMNASSNRLTRVHLSGYMILHLDLSYNQITEIKVEVVDSLKTLILGHNTLDPIKLSKILKNQIFPKLQILDISYNNLNSIPMTLSSFTPPYFYHLSIAGNKLRYVYLVMFTYRGHPFINLDVSHNEISSVHVDQTPSIYRLDLSHNKLSSIDEASLPFYLTITTLDFSRNPFNCSCSLLPPFVTWMVHHATLFANKAETKCQSANGPNIFHMKCDIQEIIDFKRSARWIVPVVITVLLVLVISVIAFLVHRRRSKYIELDPADRCCTLPYVSSIFTTCLRPRLVVVPDPHVQSSSDVTFGSQHLDFEDKLVVLCSAKDTKWVAQEIVNSFTMHKQIISSRISEVPPAEFVLIVVDGDSSITDSDLVHNVSLVIPFIGRVEVRLLIRAVPSSTVLKKKNSLSDYVTGALLGKSYFKYDREYPQLCTDSVKVWLNLDV